MKRILTALIFVLLAFQAWLQQNVDWTFKAADYVTQKKMGGVSVTVKSGGAAVQSGSTASNGSTKMTLASGKKYSVEFSAPGKVMRFVNIDLTDIDPNAKMKNNEVEVKLFDETPGVDYSYVQKNPITEFYYAPEEGAIIYDPDAASRMAKKIDLLMNEAAKKASQVDEMYAKAMEGAANWEKEEKWDLALAKYMEASKLKPKEPLPIQKIAELDEKIKKQKTQNLVNQQNDDLYKKTIAAADALKDQKKYNEALAKYNEALKLKNEQYVKDQIADINKRIEAEKKEAKLNADYDAALKAGDLAFNQRKYAEAKTKFTEASQLKPSEAYPKQKLADIDKKLKEEQEADAKKKQYEAKIAEADQLFGSSKYPEAKLKYNEAIALDGTQQHPKDRIKAIDAKLAEEQQNKQKVITLLKEAGALNSKNDLEGAKSKYQEVLKLEPGNTEATGKLNEINAKLAANKSAAEKEAQFKSLMAKANEQIAKESWPEAKQTLLEAKALKADPEIDKKIKDIDTKMSADAAYFKLLQEAQSLEPNNIDGAIAKYKQAQAQKPNDQNVKNKIAELEKRKADAALNGERDKKYAEAMKRGDAAMQAKKYSDAIKAYNEALAVKPDEKDPVTKAADAEKQLKALSNSEADKAYQKVLDAGQTAINDKNWTKAKEYYNRALGMRPADPEPKAKLKEIEDLIKAEADAKKGNDKTLAYNSKIEEAEKAAGSKKYDQAIDLYKQAQQIKPEEKLPAQRIKELTDLKNTNASAGSNEQLYKEYMAKGQEAQKVNDYKLALSEYKNALNVKAGDKTAEAKIAEVQRLINEENANLAEKEKFDALIKEADKLFQDKEFLDARKKYESALAIFGSDKYARNQVKLCIEEIQKKDDGNIAYNKLISKADENFNKKNYDKAKELYERALSLKSSDPYPKAQLEAIERALNPTAVVATTPVALPSPGTLTTDDPAEIQRRLEAAELERKNMKNLSLRQEKDSIQDQFGNTQSKKNEEILSAANTLSTIKKENSELDVDNDEMRQNYVEKAKEFKEGTQNSQAELASGKYNESLNTQETFKNMTSENSELYAKSETVYTENTESMAVYNNNLTNSLIRDQNTAYQANIDSQGKLSAISVKVDEKVVDDFESRKVVEEMVKKTNREIQLSDEDRDKGEKASIQVTSDLLKSEDIARSNKANEDAKLAGNNKEKLKTVENSIVGADIQAEQKNVETSLTTDHLLSTKQKGNESLAVEQAKHASNNAEVLGQEKKTTDDEARLKYAANVEKNINAQGELAEIKQGGDGRYDVEKRKFDQLVAEVEGVDKKAVVAYNESNLSDEEQHLNARQNVQNQQVLMEEKTTRDSKKTDQNAESMLLVTTEAQNKVTDDFNKQNEKITESRLMLDEISQQKLKFNDKVANELGALYPEGVSQEIFEQKDENGLLVSVVTRRVLVKKGYGQLYVKTQSLTGITYSKNGQPSSEYIWQRETNDASLTKNY